MNKKIIIGLLSCLLLTSCNTGDVDSENVKRLNEVTYPEKNKTYEFVDTYKITPILNFSYKTASKIMDTTSNNIYSPMSLYYALSMLSEGISDEETLKQVNDLLGNDLDTRKEALKRIYNNNYYENEYGKASMHNSLWIQNGVEVKDEYTKTLTDDYYAEIYNCNFASKEAKKTIVDWINDYTEDLMKLTTDNYEIPDDLATLILNTLYFENKWAEEFDTSVTTKKDFNLADGTTTKVDFMKHTYTGNYYDSTKFYAVTDTFYNGNSIDYFLPKEGYTINDLLNDETIYSRENGESYEIVLSVPKFKYDSSYNLNETLQSLGVTNIFESTAGHLNKINDLMYVDKVKQNAAIEIDENGAKAAAVTSIENKCTSVGPSENRVVFNLDEPFVYIIYGAGRVPLFIGNVTNPNK